MIDRRRKTNWMSRRFWQANVIILLATGLCYFGKLGGETWAVTVCAAAGFYAFNRTKENLAWVSSPTQNSLVPPPSSEG
jgi:hypothetical protein